MLDLLLLLVSVGEVLHVLGVALGGVVIDNVRGRECPSREVLDLEVLDGDAVDEEVVPAAYGGLEVDDGPLVGGFAVHVLDDALDLHVNIHAKEFQPGLFVLCLPGEIAAVLGFKEILGGLEGHLNVGGGCEGEVSEQCNLSALGEKTVG